MGKKRSHMVSESDKFRLIKVVMALQEPIKFGSMEKFCTWVTAQGINMTPATLTGMMKRNPEMFEKVTMVREGGTYPPLAQLFKRMETAEATMNNVVIGMKNHDSSISELTQMMKIIQQQIVDINKLLH